MTKIKLMSKLIAQITNPAIPGQEDRGLSAFLNAALQAILVLGAILALFYLLWAGIDWITAGGDSEKLASAGKKLTGAIVGLVLLTAVWAIWQLLINFFGIDMTFPTA